MLQLPVARLWRGVLQPSWHQRQGSPRHRLAASSPAGKARGAGEGWESPGITLCLLPADLAEGGRQPWGFQPLASEISMEADGPLLGKRVMLGHAPGSRAEGVLCSVSCAGGDTGDRPWEGVPACSLR